jgi:hypothetical protein
MCEIWSLNLWEEHIFRVSKEVVLRRTFGSKRDEVTGSWRKWSNEEIHNLHSSPSIIRMIKSRRIRWAGHTTQIGGNCRKTRRNDITWKTKKCVGG